MVDNNKELFGCSLHSTQSDYYFPGRYIFYMKLNFFKVCATNITLFIGYSTDLHGKKRKLKKNAVPTRFNISSEKQAANIQSFDRIVCILNYVYILVVQLGRFQHSYRPRVRVRTKWFLPYRHSVSGLGPC